MNRRVVSRHGHVDRHELTRKRGLLFGSLLPELRFLSIGAGLVTGLGDLCKELAHAGSIVQPTLLVLLDIALIVVPAIEGASNKAND